VFPAPSSVTGERLLHTDTSSDRLSLAFPSSIESVDALLLSFTAIDFLS
jgi:hypothetical protein